MASPEPDHGLREAAAVLSAEDAGARSARVRNVAYDLEFQLDGEAGEHTGRVRTAFELTDVRATLTVDFAGGRVAGVRVNGSQVDASYNGYFVTLPASSLRTGSNVVEIAFSHPYSTDGSGLYRFRDPGRWPGLSVHGLRTVRCEPVVPVFRPTRPEGDFRHACDGAG